MPNQTTALPGWEALLTAAGQDRLREIETAVANGGPPEAVGRRLRTAGVDPDEVSALLTQVGLRARARAKFGGQADRMLFTQAGLEQASRAAVSRLHAARFAAADCTRIADLGCGIGTESLAFQAAGLTPLPVEIDPFTAAIAAHNLGLAVVVADAESFPLTDADGVFLDPARRTAGHRDTRRLSSTDDYSPSLGFAFGLAEHFPLGIKLGPAFDRELIPEEAEAQWVSVRGDLVEMGLWFGRTAREGITRSALIIDETGTHELNASADAPDAELTGLDEYLYEPDAAVIRARLIGRLAGELSAGHLSEGIAYLSGSSMQASPFAQAFRVIEQLPARERDLSRALSARGIGRLEIKRGADVDPATLRKRLRLRGPNSATLILTRVLGRHVALLVERVAS